MFKASYKQTITIVAFLSSILAFNFAEAEEFQWGFGSGDTYGVTLNHSTTGKTQVGDFSATQVSRYQLRTQWNVLEVDYEGSATVEKTIQSIFFALESDSPAALNIAADTQAGTSSGKTFTGMEGSTLLEHLRSLVGKKLLMRITPTGKIETLPLPPETRATIDAFPATDYVLQMFDISSVAESETSYFPSLPAKSIEPGETWGRESDANVDATEAFITQFKYVGKKQGSEASLAEFSISVLPKNAGERVLPPGGAEAVSVSKQTGAGQCLFDQKMKHFVSANYRSEIVSSGSGQSSTIISEFKTKIVKE